MKKITSFFALILMSLLIFSSCTKEDDVSVDQDQVSYDNASISTGGIMYDKFWSTEAGFDQNQANFSTVNSNSNFFRCKQCHAWDGLGTKGSYINRAPRVTRPNVNPINLYEVAQNKTAKELFDAMKSTNGRRDISFDLSTYDPETNKTEGDQMPNYNQLLTDDQMWDIVKFMKEGMFDVSELYDATYTGTYPTGSFEYSNWGLNGDEAKGNAFYATNCAACHGADGSQIDMDGMGVGAFTRNKSYEVQHKVKYGQLGTSMVGEFDMTLEDMRDLYKAISNTTTFPN